MKRIRRIKRRRPIVTKRKYVAPGIAIRRFCIECVGHARNILKCRGNKLYSGCCPFYAYRLTKGRVSVKNIRKVCLDCMGNSNQQVKDCTSAGCPLHDFRFGRNPNLNKKAKIRRRTKRSYTDHITRVRGRL